MANYVETLKSTDKANGISRNELAYAKGGLHISWRALPQYGYFRSQSIQPNPAFIPVAGIKSEYNIGRYKNPDRTIEDYRVITDNGSLNLEIDYADYKDQDWRNTKIAYEKLTDKDVRKFFTR